MKLPDRGHSTEKAGRTTSSRPRRRAGSPSGLRPRSRARTASTGTRRTAPRSTRPRSRSPPPPGPGGAAAAARRHGDEAVRRVLEQASPEAVRLARQPRRLLHGRDRLPGGGRALVPGTLARLRTAERRLAVAPPEQERERQEDRAGEIGRERDPVALLPPDDRRPVAERGRGPSAIAPSSSSSAKTRPPSVSAAASRMPRERGSGLYCGSGWLAVEDALVAVPDVEEDRVDARRAAERGCDLRAGDRHALAVRDHEDAAGCARSA